MNRIHIVQPPEAQAELDIRPTPREVVTRWRSSDEDRSVQDRPGIFMTRAAYRNVNRHVHRILNVEVGGILLGHAHRSPSKGTYTVIEGSLEAEFAYHGPTHLTFTSDTLTALLNHKDDEFPDQQIVGWYHTHPGLSMFLSSLDQWLHTHFFPEYWHVALVIDPTNDQGGFFTYREAAFAGSPGSTHYVDADSPSYLDPRRYVGFYEVGGPDSKNISAWSNIEC